MPTLTDATLVERILAGDSSALAALYDRYADRIHSMCAHMLRDDDAAADVTSEVFLTAAERLGQLRDHEKVRSWLYAIARHEVYRRSRHRSREVSLSAVGGVGLDLVDDTEVDPQDLASIDEFDDGASLAPLGRGADEVGLEAGASQADLAALLQDASAGLDDRDRMVLELHLAQGLDGQELADALGVNRDHGYQLVHRMKERLEAATSALLIARSGRSRCDGLDEVADSWDGRFNVLWRKRFARHIGRCEQCSSLRSRVPKAVLSGTGLALAAQSTVLAAPISARERVLSEAPARIGVPRGGRWRPDGFPPHRPGRRRWGVAAVALAIVALVLGGGAVLVDRSEVEEIVSAPSDPPTETTTTVPPSTTVPLLPGPVDPFVTVPAGPTPGAPTTTTTAGPAPATASAQGGRQGGSSAPATTTAPPPPAPPPPPPPPPTTTTTTEPPDVNPPSISISGPSCVSWDSSGSFTASASDPSGVQSTTLSWSGAISGSKSGGSSVSVSVTFPQPATSVTFTATATDGAGNSGSTSRTVAGSPSCQG
jgi:RNA polymerase sigma factor (sigma-70 family)